MKIKIKLCPRGMHNRPSYLVWNNFGQHSLSVNGKKITNLHELFNTQDKNNELIFETSYDKKLPTRFIVPFRNRYEIIEP